MHSLLLTLFCLCLGASPSLGCYCFFPFWNPVPEGGLYPTTEDGRPLTRFGLWSHNRGSVETSDEDYTVEGHERRHKRDAESQSFGIKGGAMVGAYGKAAAESEKLEGKKEISAAESINKQLKAGAQGTLGLSSKVSAQASKTVGGHVESHGGHEASENHENKIGHAAEGKGPSSNSAGAKSVTKVGAEASKTVGGHVSSQGSLQASANHEVGGKIGFGAEDKVNFTNTGDSQFLTKGNAEASKTVKGHVGGHGSHEASGHNEIGNKFGHAAEGKGASEAKSLTKGSAEASKTVEGHVETHGSHEASGHHEIVNNIGHAAEAKGPADAKSSTKAGAEASKTSESHLWSHESHEASGYHEIGNNIGHAANGKGSANGASGENSLTKTGAEASKTSESHVETHSSHEASGHHVTANKNGHVGEAKGATNNAAAEKSLTKSSAELGKP